MRTLTQISQIALESKQQFGFAVDEGVYHYRCRLEQQVNQEEAARLGLSELVPARYTIEVQRRGDAHRLTIFSPEASDRWIELFDGTEFSGYTSEHRQPLSRLAVVNLVMIQFPASSFSPVILLALAPTGALGHGVSPGAHSFGCAERTSSTAFVSQAGTSFCSSCP